MSPEESPSEIPPDPEDVLRRLLRGLRTSPRGLSEREAERRLVIYGENVLVRTNTRRWPRELARQFAHPLALLLWAGAALAWAAGIMPVAIAVVAVIVLNAVFAFAQERQAERAVEALRAFLPQRATVLRDRRPVTIGAEHVVPGDVLVLVEGDRIPADARLISGVIEVDTSMLTGESAPVERSAALADTGVPLLGARELVFSGTTCTAGEARAVVFAIGMHTEIGRIAALSQRVAPEPSPLERQVRRVAWLIALIAVVMAALFVPLASIGAGMSLANAVVLAVGLLVGNVPEGLLPVITLALAIGVRELARRGALVKRLSAVETLGSADVICTDKTGTLTENRMRVTRVWAAGADTRADEPAPAVAGTPVWLVGRVAGACNNARLSDTERAGDPTEIALLEFASGIGAHGPDNHPLRRDHFRFDPDLKRMSTVDERDGGLWVDTKGAPETVVGLCTHLAGPEGTPVVLDERTREQIAGRIEEYATAGLRVLGLATRRLEDGQPVPSERERAEQGSCFAGLVALIDPPRPGVAEAVASCRAAGIRIIVITGDHPLTAVAVARMLGIVGDEPFVVNGPDLERLSDAELDQALCDHREIVFPRSSPEAKLRIAEALRADGHVVAMTGDGVNDAPALRRADIGVAMGRSGTDVAREAATMVLVDDDFASIVAAIGAGRRVWDNIRKFLLYIFAHTTPEIVPYLVFALGRGLIPLPLTILQLLAIDVGTETAPALALAREPAEPGLMVRPPRPPTGGVIGPGMLVRAWLFLGVICAGLAMGAYFFVLTRAGWSPGDPTGTGSPLHHAYLQATTITFLALVMGQVGTAFAARTEHASLRSIGVFSNRWLIYGIGFELALAAAIVYLPALQEIFSTAAPPPEAVLLTLSFPVIVWSADELRRWVIRRIAQRGSAP